MERVIAGIALILTLCCTYAAAGEELWSGKCVGIYDGDTILVMRRGRQVKIRLYGIDCPEIGQDFGTKARRFAGKMAFGQMVAVQTVDLDRYGRNVAWVWIDGRSLNQELLKAGLAWWYRQYAPEDTDLKNLEMQARREKLGLWSHPNPIPPWEFRKQSRTTR